MDKKTVTELEKQARQTKYLIDRIMTAYIGMTVEELIKMSMKGNSDENIDGKAD